MDVCLCFSVLCCPVSVEALRRADPAAKESYQVSKGSISKKKKSDAWKRHKEKWVRIRIRRRLQNDLFFVIRASFSSWEFETKFGKWREGKVQMT
jgi:hypothetical protein